MNKNSISKNIICYILIGVVVVIVGVLVFTVYAKQLKSNNGDLKNREIATYTCKKEDVTVEENMYPFFDADGNFVERFVIITENIYDITSNGDFVSDVLEVKEFIYDIGERYAFGVHHFDEMNMRYDEDRENLKLTIYPHEGPLLDDNGNALEVKIEDYLKDLSNNGFICTKHDNRVEINPDIEQAM